MSNCRMIHKDLLASKMLTINTTPKAYARLDLYGKACCQTLNLKTTSLIVNKEILLPISQDSLDGSNHELKEQWAGYARKHFKEIIDLFEMFIFNNETDFLNHCEQAERFLNQQTQSDWEKYKNIVLHPMRA